MKLVGFTELAFFGLIIFVSSIPPDNHSIVGGRLIYGTIIWSDAYRMENRVNLTIFFADNNPVVNADNFQISCERNESVEAVVFNDYFYDRHGDAMEFLPVRVDETFPNLILYAVFSSSVEIVTKNNFKNLRKLLDLTLNFNNITAIDEDSFDDLTELKTLNLFENKIKTLPDKIFQNLHEVKYIELGRNPITALNDQHLKNNKNLEYFSVRQCRIKFISPTMFDETKSLRNVDLTGNVCIDMGYGGYARAKYEGGGFENCTEYWCQFKNDVIANCSLFSK